MLVSLCPYRLHTKIETQPQLRHLYRQNISLNAIFQLVVQWIVFVKNYLSHIKTAVQIHLSASQEKKNRKKGLKNYDLTRIARWYLVTRRAMQIISHDRKHVSEFFFSFLCFEGVDETIQKIELHVIPHRIHETGKSIVNSYLPVSVSKKNPKTILLNFVSVRSSHHLVTCQHSA